MSCKQLKKQHGCFTPKKGGKDEKEKKFNSLGSPYGTNVGIAVYGTCLVKWLGL